MTVAPEPRIMKPGKIRRAMALAAVLCLIVGFVAWSRWNAAAVQAAWEQARSAEIAEEDAAICRKWRMPAGSETHAECMADLDAIRRRHQERLMQDMGML